MHFVNMFKIQGELYRCGGRLGKNKETTSAESDWLALNLLNDQIHLSVVRKMFGLHDSPNDSFEYSNVYLDQSASLLVNIVTD